MGVVRCLKIMVLITQNIMNLKSQEMILFSLITMEIGNHKINEFTLIWDLKHEKN